MDDMTTRKPEHSPVDESQDDDDSKVTPEQMRLRRAQRRREQQMMQEAALAAAAEAARQKDARASQAAAEEAKKTQAEKSRALAATEKANLARMPTPSPLTDAAAIEEFEVARISREARMKEIRAELRRRRRLRALGMVLRFLIFVILPTAVVGWYYFEKATDMYVSKSAMIFKTGGASTGGGLLGSFMGGAGTIQDSVALQEYILSRDMLVKLDQEQGWISHFQSTDIDEFHRLKADATLDEAYSYYAGNLVWSGKVAVSYDAAEGILRLEVTAATPEAAKRFAETIIGHGEELVNSLNERSRNDGVRSARDHVEDAREDLREAQRKVARVQEQLNIFSVESEAGALQGRIVALEAEIDEILGQIEKLKTVAKNPSDSRFIPYRTDLEVKTAQLRELRTRLTGDGTNDRGPSMAQLSSELELARVDQATTQMMYSSALTSLETAIASASEQSLYLETVVQPSAPLKSTKPNRLANTGLVFLVLFAIYIISLLTISLIREQAAI